MLVQNSEGAGVDDRRDGGEFGVKSCLQLAGFLGWNLASFAANTAAMVLLLRNSTGKGGPGYDLATIALVAAGNGVINISLIIAYLAARARFAGEGNYLLILLPTMNLVVSTIAILFAILLKFK